MHNTELFSIVARAAPIIYWTDGVLRQSPQLRFPEAV